MQQGFNGPRPWPPPRGFLKPGGVKLAWLTQLSTMSTSHSGLAFRRGGVVSTQSGRTIPAQGQHRGLCAGLC